LNSYEYINLNVMILKRKMTGMSGVAGPNTGNGVTEYIVVHRSSDNDSDSITDSTCVIEHNKRFIVPAYHFCETTI
jgi:hypothetical protein